MCPRPCHVQVSCKKQAFARCENGKNSGVYLVGVGALTFSLRPSLSLSLSCVYCMLRFCRRDIKVGWSWLYKGEVNVVSVVFLHGRNSSLCLPVLGELMKRYVIVNVPLFSYSV